MAYACELQEQSQQPALSVRTRTPVAGISGAMGEAYSAIWQYLGRIGEQPAGPPFVAYHNMDMEDLDVEIGVPVSRRLAGRDAVQASEIPQAKVATCVHVGPYGEISAAYTALTAWVQAHGYEPSGVAYEMYLNDPAQTPPQALMTRVIFPLMGD